MLDGINITIDYVVHLFVFTAISGFAVSFFFWFFGMVLNTAISAFKKGMSS